MTRDEFLQKMLEKGKITPAQLDKIKAKDAAKERYKKEKEKMAKTEMQEILDVLLS
jgi:DNA-directed RNA polymerase subunit H (RpoH/RPB5)